MSASEPLEKRLEKPPEAIDHKVSDRICKHMNKDHAAAILTYAHRYGNQPLAIAATLTAIDDIGMDLTAEVNGETLPVRIAFDHPLKDATDAHHTLVAMLRA